MNWIQICGSMEIGLIYSLIAIGIYLTFRVIDFPDLTVDGSFAFGAAISITLIVHGINPVVATIAAMIGGAIAGFITSYMNTRWGILGLLAGILTMTALYSVNLRIMGMPNISLIEEQTLFSGNVSFAVISAIAMASVIAIAWFLKTDIGLAMRAIGINQKFSRAYGINVKMVQHIALSLSNAMVALGGALFAQLQGFADISMGLGTIVIGLASLIVGESVGLRGKVVLALVGCIIGSVAYRIIIMLALNSDILGIKSTDLNLVTAVLVVVIMVISRRKNVRA